MADEWGMKPGFDNAAPCCNSMRMHVTATHLQPQACLPCGSPARLSALGWLGEAPMGHAGIPRS